MFKSEELGHILLAIIILTFAVTLKEILAPNRDYTFIFIALLTIAVIILVNIIAKKLVANYFGAKLETKIWSFQRYGIRRNHYFKVPIPAGIVMPFIIAFLTQGNFYWLAALESNITGTNARTAKRHGIFSFTEMTEAHIGLIVTAGVVVNLLLSLFGYLVNLPELARWSAYYAAYSLLPLGKLDGTKIFFSYNKSIVLWFALAIITGIFILYSVIVV